MTFSFIKQQLNERRQSNRYRVVPKVSQQNAREIVVDNNCYLNFSSNDYLGLADHNDIKRALQDGADRFGVTASSSSLVTGHHYAHQALEQTICQWLDKPNCLLFSSGFAANLGVLQALGQKETFITLDKLAHASLIEGAWQSKARVKRYLHNDLVQLSSQLASANETNKLIVTEGVFSMDGDKADIAEIIDTGKKQQALVYVDDAHSIGVIGQHGEGSCSEGAVDIVMATFGKALATSGAFVSCNNDIYEYLVNFSKHYIYSTAISPAIAWATKKSIEIIKEEQWRREKIAELSELFTSLVDKRIQLITTQSSIHGLVMGSEQAALNAAEKLKQKGIWLTAIRPPTVAPNSSRLRVTITAGHNVNDIKYLAESLNGTLVL